MGDPAESDTDPTLHYEIYLTDDGGQNWERVGSQHIPPPLPDEYGFGGVFDVADGYIWFGTDHGRVYRSKNHGADWEVFQTPLFGAYVSFADSLYGAASISDGTTQYINLTTDGGGTWTDINPNNAIPNLSTMAMVPGSRYIVVVTNENAITGPFRTLISKDLGETWLQIGEGENAAWGEFLSPSVGYAGELQLPDHPMRLYSYNGDPLSGILSGRTLDAKVSTYPNPTSDFVLVNVEIGMTTDCLLLLNDANGKLVQQEKFAKTEALSATFDLRQLTSGIYSLTIATPKGSLTRKIVKY
jgi:hypothetical protein